MQREHKAKLDAGQVDNVTVFKGTRCCLKIRVRSCRSLLTGKLRPRFDGPITVNACPGSYAYTRWS